MADRLHHGQGTQVRCGSRLKKGDQQKESEPRDHALGRSRGGFSTKIHWICERKGLPLSALVSSGAAGDAPYFHPVLEKVKIPSDKGRPQSRPKEIVADKAYDSARLRKQLRRRGIRAMIPERQLPEGRKRRKKGSRYRFDKDTYKKRAAVEQSIGWIKECRRIATRYEKLAVSFLSMIKLAFIRYYLRNYSSDTA